MSERIDIDRLARECGPQIERLGGCGTPPVRLESNYTSIYSTVLGTTKMRCVITGEGPVVRDKYIVPGEREFYIECEPATEEQ